VKVWPAGPTPAAVPAAFRAQLPRETRPVWVEAVLECGLAYASAVRRAVLEEMPGHALAVAEGARVVTNDQHYLDDLDVNLRSVPLDVAALDGQETAALRFALAARNDSTEFVPLTTAALVVVSGAGEGLFNRTVAIGPPLQPGGHVAVDDIRVVTGVGRVTGNPAAGHELDPQRATLGHPGFSAACRAALLPLDADPNTESALVAAPRRHQLRFKLKAVGVGADAGAVAQRFLMRACASLRTRVRLEAVTDPTRLQFVNDVAVLAMPGETHSISGALTAAVLDVAPGVQFVGAVEHPNRGMTTLRVMHSDPDELRGIVRDAVEHLIATFDELEEGFRRTTVTTLTEAPPNAGKRAPPPAAVYEDAAGAVAY